MHLCVVAREPRSHIPHCDLSPEVEEETLVFIGCVALDMGLCCGYKKKQIKILTLRRLRKVIIKDRTYVVSWMNMVTRLFNEQVAKDQNACGAKRI